MTEVHYTAQVDHGACVGSGTVIWHFAHVMGTAVVGSNVVLGQNVFVGANVRIGDGTKVQNNVSLYDGVTVGKNCFIGPSAVFTNVRRPRAEFPVDGVFEPTWVDDGVTVGANATVIAPVRLGKYCMVAAGAVVTADVEPFTLVAGTPARFMTMVCYCGQKTHGLPCEVCENARRD